MATEKIYFNRSGTIRLEIGSTINLLHYAKVTLSIGNTVIHASGKLPKGQEYYDWAITDAERSAIIGFLPPNSSTISGTMKVDIFWVATDKDDNLSLNDKEHAVTFVLEETESTKPTGSITSKVSEPYAAYVQSKTYIKLSVSAEALNNATVKTVAVTVGDKSCKQISNSDGSYVFESDVLYNKGTNGIIVTITDSRGFKQSIRDSIYVNAYAPPMLTPLDNSDGIVCRRWNPNIQEIDDMHGTECQVALNVYASYVPEVLTEYTLYYKYKKVSDNEWSVELPIETRTISTTGVAEFVTIITDGTITDENGVRIGKFSTESEYDIELRVIDELDGENTRYEQLPCQETSFNIKPNGMGVAMGKYSTLDKTFDTPWSIHSDADIIADGKVSGASVETNKLVLGGKEITVTADEINSLKGIKGEVQTRLTQISNSASATESNLQNNYYNKAKIDSFISSIESRLKALENK